MRLPINKRVIVIYPDSGRSRLFDNFYSSIDVREPCTKDVCEYQEEHYTYDGQFFHQGIRKPLTCTDPTHMHDVVHAEWNKADSNIRLDQTNESHSKGGI